MRLAYTEAEGCPGEQAFRDVVGLQVRRWAPFAPNAPWRLTVRITRRPSGYEGSAELRDVTGAVELKRAFPVTEKCDDLQGDPRQGHRAPRRPRAAARTPSGTASSPLAVAVPEQPAPPKPEQPTPPPWPELARLSSRGGDLARPRQRPRPTLGLTFDAGLRFSWFSITAEGRWDAPAASTVAGGAAVSSTLLLGALIPCGHAGWFSGCLVGRLGQIRGSLDVMGGVVPDQQTALLFEAGRRRAPGGRDPGRPPGGSSSASRRICWAGGPRCSRSTATRSGPPPRSREGSERASWPLSEVFRESSSRLNGSAALDPVPSRP